MRSHAAVLLAALACLAAILFPPPPAAADSTERPIVLIGTGGVMWEYINETDTPNLDAFSERSDVGSISVRAIHPATCPSEGWLTLGAGERAGDSETDGGACRQLEEPTRDSAGAWTVPHWQQYVAFAQDSAYTPQLGQLGDLTDDIDTLAAGPGAAIALADSDGHIADYTHIDNVADEAAGRDLVLIDLGQISDREPRIYSNTEKRPTGDPLSASFTGQDFDDDRIRSAMRDLDEKLGAILTDLEQSLPDANIMIVSLSDYSSTASTLQAVMRSSDTPGLLTSATTRRDGLIASTDLLPTLVNGARGPGMAITSIDAGSAAENRMAAAELDSLTRAIKPATGPMYAMWGSLWLLTFFGTVVSRRLLIGPALTAASVPAASVAMNVLPWHRAELPTLALVAGTLAMSVIIGIAARYVRRKGTEYGAGLVALATLAAFVLPILAGSPLALNSVFGALPQVGRFYGMTNMMFAITGAAGLVFAGVLAARIGDRRRAAAAVVLVGVVVTVVDGSPWHGTDFGGPPVLVPAFLVLALLTAGRRLTLLAGTAIIALAAVATALFAVVDYLRPREERTHLGDFVASALDGSALDIVVRKAGQVLALWPLILALAGALVVIIAILRSRQISVPNPLDPDGNLWVWVSSAQVIVLVGGMLINDSGPIIVIAGGMVAIPLIASAVNSQDGRQKDRRLVRSE